MKPVGRYASLLGRQGVAMVEVQCSSCHTRYRIDEQVLPEGTPTFKCSRCGHVFSLEPRNGAVEGVHAPEASMPPKEADSGAAPNGEVAHAAGIGATQRQAITGTEAHA